MAQVRLIIARYGAFCVRRKYAIGMLLVIALCSFVRVHLLDVPLERDEGEYAYAGQLLLQGVMPFKESYNMKMPGIYLAYAVIMGVFGQSITGIHLGLLIVNAVSAAMLFLIGRKLFTPLAGFASASAFAIMSLQPSVQGLFANAEHFVVVLTLCALAVLLSGRKRMGLLRIFAGGLLLGFAFVIKQHGAAFVAFGFFLIIVRYKKGNGSPSSKQQILLAASIFSLGALAPFLITSILLWAGGVLETFWFWTFAYASKYVSQVPLSAGLSILSERVSQIVEGCLIISLLAAVGAVGLLCVGGRYFSRLSAAGFLLFSFVAVCPGLYFRPHYFILMLPAFSLLFGIGCEFLRSFAGRMRYEKLTAVAILLIAALGFAEPLLQHFTYFFQLSPEAVSRATYGSNPFPESVVVADFLRKRTSAADRIAVIGSEPQIYFYAKRRAATGYMYTYALMEDHEFALAMQKQMANEIESHKPAYMVFVNISTSWLRRPASHDYIFKWFDNYRAEHYDFVGLVNIIPSATTVYLWKEEMMGYKPKSRFLLTVFARRNSGSTIQ